MDWTDSDSSEVESVAVCSGWLRARMSPGYIFRPIITYLSCPGRQFQAAGTRCCAARSNVLQAL